MQTSNAAALRAGLRLRPLQETVADTLAWWLGQSAEAQVFRTAGISRAREAELLGALLA
jgi:2'-hydroxyisoflavone reductase